MDVVGLSETGPLLCGEWFPPAFSFVPGAVSKSLTLDTSFLLRSHLEHSLPRAPNRSDILSINVQHSLTVTVVHMPAGSSKKSVTEGGI